MSALMCKCGHAAFWHLADQPHLCYFLECKCGNFDSASPQEAASEKPESFFTFVPPQNLPDASERRKYAVAQMAATIAAAMDPWGPESFQKPVSDADAYGRHREAIANAATDHALTIMLTVERRLLEMEGR